KWNGTGGIVGINLTVDECIIKACIGSIFFGACIEYFIRACPVNSTEAHWTWFARSIDDAAIELEGTKVFTRIAYGYYFGMSCRVICRGYFVVSSSYNFSVFYNDCTKWSPFVVIHSFDG